MKKRSSIRLLFTICSFVFFIIFGIVYYYIEGQREEIYEAEPEISENDTELTVSEEDRSESMESVSIVIPYEFLLCEEDGYVIVYRGDRETIYAETGISVKSLSEELQKEIKEGKPIYSESELYNFLESNSS